MLNTSEGCLLSEGPKLTSHLHCYHCPPHFPSHLHVGAHLSAESRPGYKEIDMPGGGPREQLVVDNSLASPWKAQKEKEVENSWTL